MSCPNVGDKSSSQYLSNLMPNLGGIFFLQQGDGFSQLDNINVKKKRKKSFCVKFKKMSPIINENVNGINSGDRKEEDLFELENN